MAQHALHKQPQLTKTIEVPECKGAITKVVKSSVGLEIIYQQCQGD